MSTTLPIVLSSSMLTSIILASNPATMSIWLIATACSIAISISLPSSNWFSLILLLIYVGGMLVMFSYFVVIQPNQQLQMKKMFLSLTLTLTLIYIMTTPISKLPHPTSLTPSFPPYSLTMPPLLNIFTIMALTLFLALVAVVKISHHQKGPLRPFN